MLSRAAIGPRRVTRLFRQHVWHLGRLRDSHAERHCLLENSKRVLYVNVKQSDVAGHNWGIYSAEVAEVLEAKDDALRALVTSSTHTSAGRRWTLTLTADHGMMPYPREAVDGPIARIPTGGADGFPGYKITTDDVVAPR